MGNDFVPGDIISSNFLSIHNFIIIRCFLSEYDMQHRNSYSELVVDDNRVESTFPLFVSRVEFGNCTAQATRMHFWLYLERKFRILKQIS